MGIASYNSLAFVCGQGGVLEQVHIAKMAGSLGELVAKPSLVIATRLLIDTRGDTAASNLAYLTHSAGCSPGLGSILCRQPCRERSLTPPPPVVLLVD